MTTYNSYEEAKIANPESDVYSDGDLFFTSAVKTFMYDSAKCNPTEHCKTLGWLRDNHGAEFAGDIILGHVGRNVIRITQDTIKDYDDNCLILRAAALEEKPKRVKVEYVKCEFSKLSEAAIAVDCGDIYYTSYGEQAVEEYGLALHYYNMRDLKFYRKVETEIDERQEFIDEALKLYACNANEMFGKMYDAGCRFTD
ncbi:hypothetical protein NVP2095A_03 [Vibrio phage 2.095.A._10N.286.46.E10]|nr:hypothetical protein NVP2095A_03 [Vibrio phage 2.095.A._10N.286.46.E10]AUS02161.1 hypothetical protein NVP2095B_03 [Vibrio phage 2.095.B._10N.286.46.E10]